MNNQIIKFLNQLKNASLAKKSYVLVQSSPIIIRYVEALYEEGLIVSYYKINHENTRDSQLCIQLRNVNGNILTNNIQLISKPRNPKHLSFAELCRINIKNKSCFVSTNLGLVTLDVCKKSRLGGLFSFSC